jgi:peptidoglycan/xylan/chitin deacetylase (PgdA/CDA1 family)
MIHAKTLARKLFLHGAYWSGAAALVGPLLAGRGAILMLHRITARQTSPLGLNSHLTITPQFLDLLLGDLRRRGSAILSLDEFLEATSKGGTRNAVAITADDGWLDNLTEGLSVFDAHDAPFTVYVAPALTTGAVAPWWEVVEEHVIANDRLLITSNGKTQELVCDDPRSKIAAARRIAHWLTHEVAEKDQQAELGRLGALAGNGKPQRRFLDWDDVRTLARHRLATIGAHTVHHYNLGRVDKDTALNEMVGSADIIAQETGLRPGHFAYPYGSSQAAGQREFELARDAGFASAVTTRHGVLRGHACQQLHQLPRISVNGLYQRVPYVRSLMSGLTTPLALR